MLQVVIRIQSTFCTCKIDKEYTIYVDKNNHEKFVARKFLIDLMVL